VVIEPWLTDQWYVDAKTLAQPAIEAVRSGRDQDRPEVVGKDLLQLDGEHPAVVRVSRQLWWGHQIPAWFGFSKMMANAMSFATLADRSSPAKAGPEQMRWRNELMFVSRRSNITGMPGGADH
jgi:valyl-tRNA synthetase